MRFTCSFKKHDYEEKIFLKCTILKKKSIFKKHDFEQKFFWKKLHFEWKSFCKKHDFQLKIFRSVRFWIIFFRLVRFRINFFTTRQILNQLFKQASDFDLNILQRVRFWVYFFLLSGKFSCAHHKRSRFRNVLRYGVGSVSQVILLG